MKKTISIFVIICTLFSTSIVSFASLNASNAQTAINLIDKQNFSNTTSKENVKKYINHFLFDSDFAALNNGKFNYPNSHSDWYYSVNDGSYTRNITGSRGCMAYCYFVSQVVYNAKGDRKYYKKSGSVTASELKDFIHKEAQAGEHLRVSGKHSSEIRKLTP